MTGSVTFKPLARGRFHCNGCGKAVKQRRLDAHRNAHKSRPVPAAASTPALKTAELWHGLAKCPHCDWRNFTDKSGVVVCVSCQRKFMAV